MPIKTQIWTVGGQPSQLSECILPSEQLLEDMIVSAPRLLSEEWMLIGRQENTGLGGRIDLLAIAPDASLVLIELKRDRTPRDVVAQALDYASWVEKLAAEDIAAIYKRYRQNADLAADFQAYFGLQLDEEALNQSHQIIIVASGLDASTERIVAYLSERDIAINVLCFQVFQHGEQQLISRSWLLDPVATQANASNTRSDGPSEPWNGEFYSSFGHGATRSWLDAQALGFICGGGGTWYSNSLKMLAPGDRVWVNIPQQGYVGVGRVTGLATAAADFTVSHNGVDMPVLQAATRGTYHAEHSNDPALCEYFVAVEWLQTVPIEQAIKEVGLFGNQNTVCRPTTPKWRWTIERLKERFPLFDKT